MDSSARAPGYDLFKLIVAIILLLIFICLLFWTPANAPQAGTPSPTRTTISSTATKLVATTVAPPIASSTGTSTSNASTMTAPALPSSTGTSAAGIIATSVVIPSPTGTPTPASPPTSLPTSTEAPVPEPIPTPIVETPAEEGVCDAIAQARLEVGMNATILRRLNFRSSPGIQNNWILTNRPGTQVEVVGGPVCTRYQNGGAYRWWNIRLPDGRLGWSAEASAFGGFYFIEPAR